MTSIRVIQKTVFGKAARGAQAASHAVLERDLRNKHVRKASPNQLANFNHKPVLQQLVLNPSPSPVAKSVALPRIQQQLNAQKNKHSKWYLHIKRLEEKTLKENVGIEERAMRSRQSIDLANEFEDTKEKKKRAPDSRLISELKGIPEKGKLAKPMKEDNKRTVQRVQKMGERVREELVREIAANKVPGFDYDARVGRPEISDVVMSSDLRRAKVLWVPPVLAGADVRHLKEWAIKFEMSRGYFRNMLGARIRTRFVPELEFELDTLQDRLDDPEKAQLFETTLNKSGFSQKTKAAAMENSYSSRRAFGESAVYDLVENEEEDDEHKLSESDFASSGQDEDIDQHTSRSGVRRRLRASRSHSSSE